MSEEKINQAWEKISGLLEEDISRPDNPRVLKLVGHDHIRSLCEFYEINKNNAMALIDLNSKLIHGLHEVMLVVEGGGKRAEVVSLIKQHLKTAGVDT